MDEQEKLIKIECDRYMHKHDLESDYDLLIAFYNPQDKQDVFAYIIDRQANEEIMSIKPYTNDEPHTLAEWDYNLDSYDLENLQNGYEIAYISMFEHYNFWSVLEQWMPDDIENKDGLQKYLNYCKLHGITKEVIENCVDLSLEEDVMKYYVETNQGYTIIAECTINDKSIVLAENQDAPSPFVTWETTPTRKYGYNAGHYLSSIKEAARDYSSRSKLELQYAIGAQVELSAKQKKEQER